MLLGASDDGAVEGIPEASALDIERSISNVTSNPNLFNVSPLVEFERLRDPEGRLVIRVWVPMGPSLYTFKGAVPHPPAHRHRRAREKRCSNHLDDGARAELLLGADRVLLGDRG